MPLEFMQRRYKKIFFSNYKYLNNQRPYFFDDSGCTSDMYQCYQVRVQYIDQEYRNNTYVDEFQASDWKNLSRYDNLENEVKKELLDFGHCISLTYFVSDPNRHSTFSKHKRLWISSGNLLPSFRKSFQRNLQIWKNLSMPLQS